MCYIKAMTVYRRCHQPVSYWLVQNNLIRREESHNAEVIEAINSALESARQPSHYTKLVKEVTRDLELSR